MGQLTPKAVGGPEGTLEMISEQQVDERDESGALTVSVDDFSALEERIQRAVELVKRERQARAAAEERAITAEAQVRMQSPLMDQLHGELDALRAEREQVRKRVEHLLAQLDALEL
jgi:hypothetical protein